MTYREDLVMAAVRAFAKRGPEGTTVSDIAQEAGVSQPRISQIFGCKDHAWTAAYERAALAVITTLAEEVTMANDVDQIWRATRERHPEEMMVLLHSVSCAKEFAEIRKRVLATFGEIAAMGNAHGYDADEFVGRGILSWVTLSLKVPALEDLNNRQMVTT